MSFSEDLKNAVLQIALQGKLTKQLESDSSVEELIKKIQQEKEILVERKKARADKDFGPIKEDEIELEIPSNWKWLRVSDIGVYKKGPFGSNLTKSLFVPKSERTIKVYEQKNAIKKDASLGNYYITEEYYNSEMKGYSVEPGDIIVSCAGTIGETYVLPKNIEKGIINQALMRMNIVDSINLEFFLFYFDHILKKSANKASNGSAIKNIPPFDIFKAMLFPLPPIEEQQRIVDKLKQTLPLIDEYGKNEGEWTDLCESFPLEMKNSVLQAAFQGKLSDQRITDSNASDLLNKLKKKKQEYVSKGLFYNKKETKPYYSDEDYPYELPNNWKLMKLSDVSIIQEGAGIRKFQYTKAGTQLLSVTNILQGSIDLQKKQLFVSTEEYKRKYLHLTPKKGDILTACSGGSWGKVAIFDKDDTVMLNTSTLRLRFFDDLADNNYLYLLCQSPLFKEQLKDQLAGMQPNFGYAHYSRLILPLPPIEEQQRIVEKLNTILPIIDSMSVYGTRKNAGRPKQEEALAFISSLLGTNKSTDSKPITSEIIELTSKAKEELPVIVKKYADLMDVTYNRITIRHQKTRWGSCTKTGNLSFNCLLMKMPENVRDYVIVHELSHRKELNHSARFWEIVARYCPWYKESKLWLKDNGNKLLTN